jgi:hypothetical protein
MVLMDVPALEQFMEAASKVLASRGAFLFSVAHPWFWPKYYGYADESWFRYSDEIFIEGPFRISQEQHLGLLSASALLRTSSSVNKTVGAPCRHRALKMCSKIGP